MRVLAGVAARDITPPAGLEMSGFAARTGPALGCHDPLTVRALAIGDTVIVIADVIGIDAALSARIADRCAGMGDVVAIATHTHGGPVSMPGRLGHAHDPGYLHILETACVLAAEEAVARKAPARLHFGSARPPGVARNRRAAGGPVDEALPVLLVRDARDAPMAILASYGCHPVVLDAANRYWTADYPHFARRALEARFPGATALFTVGCAGDANTGHAAAASNAPAGDTSRSFAMAERIGTRIAEAVGEADFSPVPGTGTGLARRSVELAFVETDRAETGRLARGWRAERATADPFRAALLDHWLDWAETVAGAPRASHRVTVSALRWGEIGFLALPGEIFAATGLSIRQRFDRPLMIASYAGDNPGYIPPREAYGEGGYEIEEAHRYYRMPAAFAPGGAEAIADAARDALETLWDET